MSEAIHASVSVIVPCYCCAKTIARAVESVAKQSLLPEEVLLVEDKSGDGTLDELRRLEKLYPLGWIKVLESNENVGPAAARNTGWNRSKGKYVAFLDADDSWVPEKLAVQYAWMEAHPEFSLTGTSICVHECDKTVSEVWQNDLDVMIPTRAQMLLSNRFATPSIMMRNDVAFRFSEPLRYAEDYLLWLRLFLSGHRVALIKAPLTRLHKAPFGASGLSADLAKMARGEIRCYEMLYGEKLITKAECWVYRGVVGVKLTRRWIISFWRQLRSVMYREQVERAEP